MNVKKLLALVIALCLCTALAACGGGNASAPTAAPAASVASTAEAAPAASSDVKVAMLLTGPINDAGWNESAYKGLMTAKDELGIETAYSESVAQPDFETVMRDYADKGYSVIICHGNEFSDATMAVAPDFPEVMFCVVNGNTFQEPNMASFRFNTPQTGFLAGAAAALLSKSGTVGMIGGTSMPHIVDALDSYEAGAKYINPDINVLLGYTEDMSDVARGMEMGTAFIEQGADVLCANANQAALGVIDAAKTKDIQYIGYINDQNDIAPEIIKVSSIQSVQFMVATIIEKGIAGELTPALHLMGAADGAIFLSDFHGNEDAFGEGGVEKLQEIFAGILDGSLKEAGILPPSVFEGALA